MPRPMSAPAPGERPKLATVATYLMIAAGLGTIGLAVYVVIDRGSLFGVLILAVLGFVYAYGGRGLMKDESWGWGAGVFGGVLYLLLGYFIHLFVVPFMGIAVVVIVLLYLSRGYYGMVRFDPDAEERKKAELRASRTANPQGIHCPKCGSPQLWISEDGSAFCEACKTGTVALRPSA